MTAEFNTAKYCGLLEQIISTELRQRTAQFEQRKIRGLAVDFHPWHKVLELCFVTDLDEDYVVEKGGTWWLADCKYFQFTRTPEGNEWPASRDVCEAMFNYCENDLPEDDAKEYGRRCQLMFRICAQALGSAQVNQAMKGYSLTDDFEIHVSNPDKPKVNLCQTTIS